MTDFISKKEESNYTDGVLNGIQLHRQIDQFTDAHPSSKELRAMLRKRHKKYAPVVVDLIWDHCLSINWMQYSGTSLDEFSKEIYSILLKRKAELPTKLKDRIEGMIENEFLLAYANYPNMRKSLAWMDKRVKFDSEFTSAIDDFKENENRIQELFSDFFPQVIAHSEKFCAC